MDIIEQAQGEPNDHNGREECVEDFLQADYSPVWNDMNCDAVNNWICKVQRGVAVNPPVNPPQLHYGRHIFTFFSFGNKCKFL